MYKKRSLLLAAIFWGQTQSFIENFNELPLISANWEGNYQPYVVKNFKYEPLIDKSVMSSYKEWDFYAPQALNNDVVILSGSKHSGPNYDIFSYNVRTKELKDLTDSPDIDEGDICVNKKTGLMSYRSDVYGQIITNLQQVNVNKGRIPRFSSCSWIDQNSLVGVTSKNEFYMCKVSTDVVCDKIDFKLPIFWAGVWRDNCITLMTSKNNYRRPWCYKHNKLEEAPFALQADILDYNGSAYRIGSKGKYRSSTTGDDGSVVFYIKKIGEKWFSILGNKNATRTLAVQSSNGWAPIYYYDKKPDAVVPKELWIKDVQSFYWTVPAANKAVIWIHGGPTESVSPRYNPYYGFLNSIGFNVMAVNYQGSTGRGNQFELKFTQDILAKTIKDCVAFLKKNKIRTVVLWGVSTGNKVTRYSLNSNLGVSGIIDQAGFDNAQLVALSRSLGIPYFSIRGKDDTYDHNIAVNFMYEGGHDITREKDFISLTAEVKKFLQNIEGKK